MIAEGWQTDGKRMPKDNRRTNLITEKKYSKTLRFLCNCKIFWRRTRRRKIDILLICLSKVRRQRIANEWQTESKRLSKG